MRTLGYAGTKSIPKKLADLEIRLRQVERIIAKPWLLEKVSYLREKLIQDQPGG